MAIEGRPELRLDDLTGAEKLSVAVVVGSWHEKIASGLLAGAIRVLETVGASYRVIHVPGSFELPVTCKTALESGYDAAVALGVIIRGGTPHFDFVSNAATDGLTRVALDTGRAVGFGVLTLDDEAQGIDRAGFEDSKEDKGAEATQAALQTALTLKELAS